MSDFLLLFSTKPEAIQKTCVLLPFVSKHILNHFDLKKLSAGKLYDTGQVDHLSIIRTGMGATFLGDAVLYLKETAAENLILFGACGVTPASGLNIGDVVIPQKCLALESFSEILNGQLKSYCETYPDREFLDKFIKSSGAKGIKIVGGATFASLKLEENHLDFFKANGVEIVDMECSAFFEAARVIRRKALAVFFVTDIIGTKPLFSEAAKQKQAVVDKAIVTGIKLIRNI